MPLILPAYLSFVKVFRIYALVINNHGFAVRGVRIMTN